MSDVKDYNPEIEIECPKCKKANLIMADVKSVIGTMTYFGCPECSAVFYNNGYDLSEVKK
jgi:ssDNA-binding Zn-finger/Zn-ribbon topoisomerase 1